MNYDGTKNPNCARILIIGYGNKLRSDDGIGPFVAEAIAEQNGWAEGVETIACHQLTPDLADDCRGRDFVIFIDANCQLSPGQIEIQRLSDQPLPDNSLGHYCSPAEVLSWAKQLYDANPGGLVVSIGVASLDFGSELTSTANEAALKSVGILEDLIKHVSGEFASLTHGRNTF